MGEKIELVGEYRDLWANKRSWILDWAARNRIWDETLESVGLKPNGPTYYMMITELDFVTKQKRIFIAEG